MSKRNGPSPRAMNGGSPPTAPNARAGLLTPPGISRRARSNAALPRGRGTPDGPSCGTIRTTLRSSPAAVLESLTRRPAEVAHPRVRVFGVKVANVAIDRDGPLAVGRVGGRRHRVR